MKAALLVCDHIRKELVHIDGEYPDMFEKLFPEINLKPFWVCDGEFPTSTDQYDIYICSGSKHSVYDDIPWIGELNSFVNAIYKANKTLVGLCFGHQMIAQALGGKVEKAIGGWSIGVHEFEVTAKDTWMTPDMNRISLLLMCQDQVAELPENSQIHAATYTCPIGIYSIDNRFLGIQAHPEFSKEYHQALFTIRSEQIGKEP